jgi:hypothetical protein
MLPNSFLMLTASAETAGVLWGLKRLPHSQISGNTLKFAIGEVVLARVYDGSVHEPRWKTLTVLAIDDDYAYTGRDYMFVFDGAPWWLNESKLLKDSPLARLILNPEPFK